jgi:prepilin-type N-terminal cleavage/methylation domain-containing protein
MVAVMIALDKKSKVIAMDGYSLIELMVVVAIIGILASLGIPTYREWNTQYQLRQAVTQIGNTLTLSRMAAMNRDKIVTVTLASAGGTVTLGAADSANSVILPDQTMQSAITGVVSVPPPNPPAGPITVQFSPRGIRSNPIGTADLLITVSNVNGLQYSLVVKPTGKVKWCPASVCV